MKYGEYDYYFFLVNGYRFFFYDVRCVVVCCVVVMGEEGDMVVSI